MDPARRATKIITKKDALERLEMAKDAAKSTLDTQLGLGMIATEGAICGAWLSLQHRQ